MIMKKHIVFFSAFLGLFAFASCEKEVNTPEQESNTIRKSIPFEVVAKTPDTKTTVDAETWEMDWEDGDVLYAVTTDEEWGAAYVSSEETNLETIAEFTYSGSKFSTTDEISDGEHTFNFLYTANGSQKTYHRGKSTSFSLLSAQNEDAEAPTAALKMNDVLAGQVKATTPTTFVNVSMKHLFTLMKVTLKNKTGEELTVNKFEISAEDAILAGIFNVTFGETPSISLKQSGKSSIAVEITNGTIAAGGELPVYFVMAPLKDYSGNITFRVTDSEENTYTKTNAVSALSFTAGSYNTASYSLKGTDEKDEPTGDGTLEYPFNVAGAMAYINKEGKEDVYVSGVVSKVVYEFDAEHETGTFWMSEDGQFYDDLTKDFEAYKVYWLQNRAWVEGNGQVKVGDHVVLHGKLTKYSKSGIDTYETSQKEAYVYSVNGRTENEVAPPALESISVSGQTVDFYTGSSFVFDGVVTASYNDGTTKDVTGLAVITPPDLTTEGEKFVNIEYTENDITKSSLYSIVVSKRPETETITITFDNVSATSYSTSETIFNNSGFSFGYVNMIRNNSNGTPLGWAKNQVIQCKASSGELYNTTSLESIQSVRVYVAANTNLFTLYYGEEKKSKANSISRPTTPTGTEEVQIKTYENKTEGIGTSTLSYYDFDLSGENASYFDIVIGSKAVYIYKIEIKLNN